MRFKCIDSKSLTLGVFGVFFLHAKVKVIQFYNKICIVKLPNLSTWSCHKALTLSKKRKEIKKRVSA